MIILQAANCRYLDEVRTDALVAHDEQRVEVGPGQVVVALEQGAVVLAQGTVLAVAVVCRQRACLLV